MSLGLRSLFAGPPAREATNRRRSVKMLPANNHSADLFNIACKCDRRFVCNCRHSWGAPAVLINSARPIVSARALDCVCPLAHSCPLAR